MTNEDKLSALLEMAIDWQAVARQQLVELRRALAEKDARIAQLEVELEKTRTIQQVVMQSQAQALAQQQA